MEEENTQLPDDSEGESDDGKEWCICKGPDDGRKMINCDGCENWFHLKCLKIPDYLGDLIKDFYCPSCSDETHKTKYNPYCTLPNCKKPARIDLHPAGNWKYCSDDHGKQYMVLKLRKVRDDQSTSKGGAVSKGELLAMLQQTNSVEEFQALGKKPTFDASKIKDIKKAAAIAQNAKVSDSFVDDGFTPLAPSSVNGTPVVDVGINGNGHTAVKEEEEEDGVHMRGGGDDQEMEDALEESLFDPGQYDEQLLNDDEMTRVIEIEVEKANAKAIVELYKRKGEFLNQVKERNTALHARIKASEEGRKTTCGFDSILALNDPQLSAFFEILPPGKLEVPEIDAATIKGDSDKIYGKWARTDGFEDAHSICIRRKCAKHGDWMKIMKDDAKYQSFLTNKLLVKLELEEKEIREVAQIRALVDDE